ncbi:MAG: hypothetical protein ABSF08_09805 [Candidatus Cybelea sp.]|jgi:hypothetical protein
MTYASHFRLLTCAVVASLAGCGQQLTAGGLTTENAWQTLHTGPWTSPDASKVRKLLYVSSQYSNDVYVYDYDKGRLLEKLSGFSAPYGQCVDAKGDVWITNYSGSSVVEYAHGGTTPLKTLQTHGNSVGCSVAPSGDLAVANFGVDPKGQGALLIFKKASGKPKQYISTTCFNMWPPGYAESGNLYVEGYSEPGGEYVCELPAGGNALRTVKYSAYGYWPGAVMWDGKYITLTEQVSSSNESQTDIYQESEDASGNLTQVGKTVLSDDCFRDEVGVVQPFIVGEKNTPENSQQGTSVVGGNDQCNYRFDYWAYPAGGLPTSTLKSSPLQPYGQSVSIAPR